jgi:branched-chain amino acid aminotransferase
MPVVERTVDLTELYIADEVLACGTSAYLSPVIEIDARKIGDGKPGKETRRLKEAYSDILYGKDRKYEKYLTLF